MILRTLAGQLLLVVTAGVIAVYASAVATWRLIELPDLYERERVADANYIERIRTVVTQYIRDLENATQDYSGWNES